MKRYCFYCALPDLVPQAEDGAFAALDPDRWRVTATLTAISARPAHAVTEGTLFFQYSEVANRLNCVLSPDRSPGFPDSPVQFIVYRGIELDSLVEADGQTLRQGDGLLQRLWAAQLDYNAIFGPSLNPTIDLLGVDTAADGASEVATLLAGDDAALAPYARPRVRTGDYLGRFATDSVSIEVVLSDPRPDFTLARLRAAENVLMVDSSGAQDDAARDFLEAMQREQLLAYLDPCHFFTALWAQGALEFPGTPPPDLATWIATWWTAKYAYIDIRNEHGHSLDFYRNYAAVAGAPASVRVQRAADIPHTVDYPTDGWPLLRGDLTIGDFDPLRVQLPIGDNGPTRAHVSSPMGEYMVALSASGDAGYTTAIALQLPRQDPVWLPTVFRIRYLRPLGVPAVASVDYRPVVAHRLDDILDLTRLAVHDSLDAPYRAWRSARWRKVFVDVGPATEGFVPAWLTSAIDEAGVYLYASRARRALVDRDAGEMLSQQGLISDDQRVAGELPFADLRIEILDWNGASLHLADLPGIAADELVGIALTRDQYLTLMATVGGFPHSPALARLHLIHVEHLANGVHVFALVPSSAGVAADGHLHPMAPMLTPEAPLFYSHSADPAYLFSDAYLAGLPADVAEHPMAHSFIMPDNRVSIRRSPQVVKVSAEAWDAAGEQVTDSQHNLVGQTTGQRPVPITVHGKRLVDDETWFLITFNEATELIDPAFVPSNYEDPLKERLGIDAIAIAGHTRSIPAGTAAWARAKSDAIIVVASYQRFERDLRDLLDTLTGQHPDDSLDTLMTRLRMLTKERHSLVGATNREDRNNGVLSRMFDVLIGTVTHDADGKIVSAVTPDPGLEDAILDRLPQPTMLMGEAIDTALLLFRDYTAFYIDGGDVIDLHHIFVGLDVVRGQQAAVPRTITNAELTYAISLPGVDASLLMPNDFSHTVLDAVAAALWVGDIAAAFTLQLDRSHSAFEKDWDTDHPGASTERRGEAIARHYFNASAPDKDLFPDVIAYLLRHDLGRRVRGGAMAPRDALVASLRRLQEDLAVRGDDAYFRFFEDDLRRKAPTDDLVAWMGAMIVNFAQIFTMRSAVMQVLEQAAETDAGAGDTAEQLVEWIERLVGLGDEVAATIADLQTDLVPFEQRINAYDGDGDIKPLALTTQFVGWYHRRGGIDFLGR